MFLARPMSEFKFACPICGQRMAVDSSATGAQVECPTCFQIVIVPKAPMEGSKYHLSATQYIKPVVLPPPSRPRSPVVPQRKNAVLIFILIFACAVTTALFIREKIVASQGRQAAAGMAQPSVKISPLWKLDLAGAAVPQQPVAGRIHGRDFVSRQTVLQGSLLMFHSKRGWQSPINAGIFISTNVFLTNAAQSLNGRGFDISTNHMGFAPGVSLFWRDGGLRVMEVFTNNFAMKLQFGDLSNNTLPGEIYLCLPDTAKSYLAGTFTAEVQRFPRPPRRSP